MGSTEALAYLASPQVVAASALSGFISGPGAIEVPADWDGIDHGYGNGQPATIESELSGMLQQISSVVDRLESADDTTDAAVEIVPGFPESVSGEVVFMDMDNQDTDQIYPGSMTYQDNVSRDAMAKACMKNYDPSFKEIIKPNDILVSGLGFGCGSSREQAATSILANSIPIVVAGSFSNIFSRNAINNALLTLELPRLVERLRQTFPKDPENPVPTRRTGWTFKWDVKRSLVEIQEGEGKEKWTERVGNVPPNVQEIIVRGGLEEWCKHELKKAGQS